MAQLAPPIASDREAVGEDRQTEMLLLNPTPTMVKLAWGNLPQLAADLPVKAQEPQIKVKGMPKGPKIVREDLQTKRTPVHFSVSDVKVGATWLGMCNPSQVVKPNWGELRE